MESDKYNLESPGAKTRLLAPSVDDCKRFTTLCLTHATAQQYTSHVKFFLTERGVVSTNFTSAPVKQVLAGMKSTEIKTKHTKKDKPKFTLQQIAFLISFLMTHEFPLAVLVCVAFAYGSRIQNECMGLSWAEPNESLHLKNNF